jgi:hypothetical protein
MHSYLYTHIAPPTQYHKSSTHTQPLAHIPLFIRVAESMVIFLPMLQLGCVMACSTVTYTHTHTRTYR